MSVVSVGKLGAPYGIQGWQHIHSYTDPVANILDYQRWYVQLKNEWVPMPLKGGRKHGSGLVAHLEGVDNPETAALYTNLLIGVAREDFPALPDNEFYWSDLEGLAVESTKGEDFGHIVTLYKNAQTDVMVVKHQDRERHIPFMWQDTVVSVDCQAKRMIVDWDPTY
jgi:16S rRNA processing protein RimM